MDIAYSIPFDDLNRFPNDEPIGRRIRPCIRLAQLLKPATHFMLAAVLAALFAFCFHDASGFLLDTTKLLFFAI